jgi:hypothetical protein
MWSGAVTRPPRRHGGVNHGLVGVLHVCLERGVLYDEGVAWTSDTDITA